MSIAVLKAPESPSQLEVLKDQHRQINLNENRLQQVSSLGSTSNLPITSTANKMISSVEGPTFKYKVSGGTNTSNGNGKSDWKYDTSDDGDLGDTTDDGGSLSKSKNETANKNAYHSFEPVEPSVRILNTKADISQRPGALLNQNRLDK